MSGFFSEIEVPEEEVDAIILETAKRIKKYGMEMAAIMALESLKPLAYVGGELTRLTLSPFFPMLGSNIDMWGEKVIHVFEERKNIEKLILLLEKMPGEEVADSEPAQENEETDAEPEDDEPETKNGETGWRRWLPFA
jgi:hypothetical protein